jgi:hypothetical protein
MPSVNANPQQYLIQQIQLMQQQIKALQIQQQYVVLDANQNSRVQMGRLPNSDYGILLTNSIGQVQELMPTVSSWQPDTLSTAYETAEPISGAPAVEVMVGANGTVRATCSSYISTASLTGASVYIFGESLAPGGGINVIEPTQILNFANYSAYDSDLSLAAVMPFGELTPGLWYFANYYSTTSGASDFTNNYLEIMPTDTQY